MINIPLALAFDDVLLVPRYSEVNSRQDIDLSTQISPNLKLKIPLIPTKMDTITGVKMAIRISELGGIAILPRFEKPDIQANKVVKVVKAKQRVIGAVGVKNDFMHRAELLVKAGVVAINVDVAHGHMKKTIETTRLLKRKFGDITIISGISSTYECAKDLYEAGADSVLVGVGAGSICTTRIQTGHGVPSITSLIETAKAAKEYKKTFIPDAGIRNSGDIVKSLATGACAIVAGYIFAGTDECPGDFIKIDGREYKNYNGSASELEKQKQLKGNPQGKSLNYTNHIEGVKGLVERRGPLQTVVEKLLAGVKSGLSYSGSRNLKELQKKAKFIRVSQASIIESGSHDVIAIN